MKKVSLAAVLISLLLPAASYANCPNPSNVTYQCVTAGGKQHCQWSAPWWDGYQGDVAMGEHPVKFFEVFWGASSNPEMGSTVCFYQDKHGDLVQLSQNNWGGIPKPTSPIWKDGTWPASDGQMMGKVCDDSLASCAFNYGG